MKTIIKGLLAVSILATIVVGCANNNVSINKELFKDKYAKDGNVVKDDFYIYQNTKIKDKQGNEAEVFVGVPVKVLSEKDDKVEVEFSGYLIDDSIYSTPSKQLAVAKLSRGFEVVKKDDNLVVVNATLNKDMISNDLADIWGEQEEFYYEMCTQCHAGPQVKTHSMLEWGAIFETMKGFAKLDEAESEYLVRFLRANSYDGLVKQEQK